MNDNYLISPDTTLIASLKYMDAIEKKILVVTNNHKFIGVISIGDIQRAILNKVDLQDEVSKHIRSDIIYAHQSDDIDNIKKQMHAERIECMPVVDENNNLVDIIEWDDILGSIKKIPIHCPVVIMAGGEGQRLRPLTNIIPKPLIPISDKTIIEEIMNRFVDVDCHDFYLSVNYMSDVIKDYFKRINNHNYNISYLKEDKPLGTAGSLFLLKDTLKETFVVSNCDVLIDVNFGDLINYHRTNGNVATIVSVVKTNEIPYGTIETGDNGSLLALNEKPTNTYQINAGLYVLEPEIFSYINDGEFVHITTLLLRLVESGKKVGVFPVSEKSYVDMGNWHEYMKIIKRD